MLVNKMLIFSSSFINNGNFYWNHCNFESFYRIFGIEEMMDNGLMSVGCMAGWDVNLLGDF